MKNILCFGDSNTYGFVPAVGTRYERDVRWTGRLQKILGDDYYVIEEGLNGRTCVFDDPVDFEECKNGRKALPVVLGTHIPLDLVIIMLGTNDTKLRFRSTPYDIAKAAGKLAAMVKKITAEKNFDGKAARVLLVSPIHIGEGMADTSPFREEFGAESIGMSHELADYMKKFAEENGAEFMNAADFAEPSPIDSLHMSEESHRALAEGISRRVLEILG